MIMMVVHKPSVQCNHHHENRTWLPQCQLWSLATGGVEGWFSKSTYCTMVMMMMMNAKGLRLNWYNWDNDNDDDNLTPHGAEEHSPASPFSASAQLNLDWKKFWNQIRKGNLLKSTWSDPLIILNLFFTLIIVFFIISMFSPSSPSARL